MPYVSLAPDSADRRSFQINKPSIYQNSRQEDFPPTVDGIPTIKPIKTTLEAFLQLHFDINASRQIELH